jgi:hypothetical protein
MVTFKDNYIELKKKWYSRYNEFVYIDVDDHLADDIFVKNKIPVKFRGDYKHDDKKYVLVYCKVKPKYIDEFLNSLGELKNEMFHNGFADYDMFCKNMLDRIRQDCLN